MTPRLTCLAFLACLLPASPAAAQIPPNATDLRLYTGLHAAAAKGDAAEVASLAAAGAKLEDKDARGRTALHIATHRGHRDTVRALVKAGANPNALDGQRYDIVTIAAVANDVPMLKLAIELGCSPGAITSPYDGTALIAAAHLGHAEVVRTLIAAGAPLDHVNNLGWTALIESILLGPGDAEHTSTLEALVKAGANTSLADRSGATPLTLARDRNYAGMVRILEAAGAK
ncbi:MAG: ankyrin repeat domain-containing protein [Rhizobiales bacterium]|nr:ankyrin repeat domain-containing protein [Hyphomicrobiales bacterium]